MLHKDTWYLSTGNDHAFSQLLWNIIFMWIFSEVRQCNQHRKYTVYNIKWKISVFHLFDARKNQLDILVTYLVQSYFEQIEQTWIKENEWSPMLDVRRLLCINDKSLFTFANACLLQACMYTLIIRDFEFFCVWTNVKSASSPFAKSFSHVKAQQRSDDILP